MLANPNDLMQALHRLYERAHKVCPFKRADVRVRRVGGVIVASPIEDVFAGYVCASFPRNRRMRVFINPTINIGNNGRARKPDIVICTKAGRGDYRLVHILEIKADTGHMRTRREIRNKCLRNARKLCARLNSVDEFEFKDTRGEDITVKVVIPVKVDVVIMTSRNNAKGRIEDICEEIRQCDDECVKMVVLTNDLLFDRMNADNVARPLVKWFEFMMERISVSLKQLNGI